VPLGLCFGLSQSFIAFSSCTQVVFMIFSLGTLKASSIVSEHFYTCALAITTSIFTVMLSVLFVHTSILLFFINHGIC
jgi:hypothetical protein